MVAMAFIATLVPAAAFAQVEPAPADSDVASSTSPVLETQTSTTTPDTSTTTPTPTVVPTPGPFPGFFLFAPFLPPPVVTSTSTVHSETEFNTALSNSNITTIYIGNDFTDAGTVTISRSVTIEGTGHTITAAPTVTGQVLNLLASGVSINNLTLDASNLRINGLNVYVAENVSLSHDTFKNSGKGGLIVNGSTVTADTLTTSGNAWYGVDVDQGGGVTHAANLTISGTSSHADGTQPAIFVDNTSKDVHVLGATSQYQMVPNGSSVAYYLTPACGTDTNSFDTFAFGSVNGQNGWSSTGSFDQAIAPNVYGFSSFGCKVLRISNAVTSGSFGDQTFSYSTTNEAGETVAATSSFSGGTRQNHFDAQFDLAAATSSYQTGLILSISPDRGDGARMSYLRLEDSVAGINVFFDDVQGTGSTTDFVETQIAGGTAATPALSRTAPHTLKFSIDFVNGPSNDVVKISIDGSVVHTGTTWENYYRYETESNPTLVDTSRTVDSLLFRAGGTASPTTRGKGFLFDNVAISTSATPVVPAPTPTPNNGGGGGGGGGTGTGGQTSGGGSNSSGNSAGGSTTTTSTTGGQVLGASTFNFDANFGYKARGEEVTQLQTILIAEGYLHIDAPTGYFGALTKAALKKWQKAHGIPPTGYAGPLTRAALNLGTTPVVPGTTTSTTTVTTH
jgi:hypothetical protein